MSQHTSFCFPRPFFGGTSDAFCLSANDCYEEVEVQLVRFFRFMHAQHYGYYSMSGISS